MAPGPHVPHPVRPYLPLIVNVALTGMVARRTDSPHVPLSPEEIVADGSACVAHGASILHIHARAADGSPAWERSAFSEILVGLRERCPDAILCVTTSGRDVSEVAKRGDVLELDGPAKPDMASLTLGSLNFRTHVSVNAPEAILDLAHAMRDRGIRPELEVFDSGMGYLARELEHRGVIEPPHYANVVLGGPNTAPATARDLAHLVDSLPGGTVWAAAGIGAFQLPMNALAIFMGGHVRTGLEDNLWLDVERRRPATNPALVERITRLAELAGRRVATPDEARGYLGLGDSMPLSNADGSAPSPGPVMGPHPSRSAP